MIPQTASCTSCPTQTTGQVNNAYDFNGVSNFVEYGDILNLQFPVTLAAWIKLDNLDNVNPIIFTDDGTNYAGYFMFITPTADAGGKIYAGFGDNSGSLSTYRRIVKSDGGLLNTNQWYHIAVVISGQNDIQLYLDGTAIATTYDGVSTVPVTTSSPITVGRRVVQGTNYFAGDIDEVKVFNQALSVAEIQTLIGVSPGCTINADCAPLTFTNPITQCNLTSGDIPTLYAEYVCSNYQCVLSGSNVVVPGQSCSDACGVNPNDGTIVDQELCYNIGQTTCPVTTYAPQSCVDNSYVTYACSVDQTDAVQTTINCDDQNSSTIDSCDDSNGCVYTPTSNNLTSQTISLSSGWNLVSLNIYSDADSSDFGSMIVMKYANNDWVMDFEGMNAFELVPLEGYYVYSTQDNSVVFSGESLSSGYRYSLVNGTWNLFSVHSSGSYSSLYSDNAYSLFSATASGTNQISLNDNLVPGSLYWANLRGPEYSLPQSEAEESAITTVFRAFFKNILGYVVRDFD
nr:hypothetical protein [Nanoarchaeum sp.]